MLIARDKVRPDILARPCEKCDEPLEDDRDFILTFFRGEFIVLHEECAGFIDDARKGKRANGRQDECRIIREAL